MKLKHFAVSALALAAGFAPIGNALAQTTQLRMQVIFGADTDTGKLIARFVDDVETMSDGEIDVEMFYGASVAKGPEAFDAAVSGVLDCDMSTGGYQTGKNPGFQFVGDIMGGYNDPFEQLSWLYFGGGLQDANKLYHKYDMHLVGWYIHGMESLGSTRPLRNPDDLKGWKFRLPGGMGHDIFRQFGAEPVAMSFGEAVSALQSGAVEGADASNISTNANIGLYDTAKHTNYPGFHSMPSDHLACNKAKWDAMPEHHRRIIETAMQKLALQAAMTTRVKNAEDAATLPAEKGLNIYDWSAKDRATFRNAAQQAWQQWAEKSPEAKTLVESHVRFMKKLGLLK